MTELKLMSERSVSAEKHIIFFHGLNGDKETTWQSSSKKPVFWPVWLSEKNEKIAIWTVGYDAAISNWQNKTGMPIEDRGVNILARLKIEKRLMSGEIILIGHSLGGLIIKQILREADSQAGTCSDAHNFINRVRRVAFLGTPHSGSSLTWWANLLKAFGVRTGIVIQDLKKGTAKLRDLKRAYKNFSIDNNIETLTLTETKTIANVLIVSQESADPGIHSTPIPIDVNHFDICKPKNKDDDIYIHIDYFVNKDINNVHPTIITKNQIKLIDENVKTLLSDKVKGGIKGESEGSEFSIELFDREIKKQITIIKKSRFFSSMSFLDKVNRFADKVNDGELSNGSNKIRCLALAWCARIQSTKSLEMSEKSLKMAKELRNSTPETEVAEAFLLAKKEDISEAISTLMQHPNSFKNTAALMILYIYKSAEDALKWSKGTQIGFSKFNSEGKITYILILFKLKKWKLALEKSEKVNKKELSKNPALINVIAHAFLLNSIPEAYRDSVFKQIPFGSLEFKFSSDTASLKYRKKAMNLFYACSKLAIKIGCVEASNISQDYAVWIELHDSKRHDTAIKKLEKIMKGSDSELILRRFPFAMQFKLSINYEKIEKEITKVTALKGGNSMIATIARFALAFSPPKNKMSHEYINEHREQLTKYINKPYLYDLEIRSLFHNGYKYEAESLLKELSDDDLSIHHFRSLNNLIAADSGEDSITSAIDLYEKTSDLQDLQQLVNAFEVNQNYNKAHFYSLKLYNETRSYIDAERLVNIKACLNKWDEIAIFLRKSPELIDQSVMLQEQWAWILYREGKLVDSLEQLNLLKNKRDHINLRSLEINLALTSGDWSSLNLHIEIEWKNRKLRSANELIQLSQLAIAINSKRAKGFILEAAEKEPENPQIIASAYFSSYYMGWEEDSIVSKWFNETLVQPNNVIQSITTQALEEKTLIWKKNQEDLWFKINQGLIPAQLGVTGLNKTIAELYILPAISNPNQPDLRHRRLVSVFSSNHYSANLDITSLALDATSILILGYLNVLEKVIFNFSSIQIPHSTMRWLFLEKQKIAFNQPSLIEKAKIFGELIADGKIKILSEKPLNNIDLAIEIGEELTQLLEEAKNKEKEPEKDQETIQKIVVRSNPVHNINTFMSENVDLTGYLDCICNCSDIVIKLLSNGFLDEELANNALKYLKQQENKWPETIHIDDNAILYLDSLSVDYLQATNLLEKLHLSDFVVYVLPQEVTRQKELRLYETEYAKINDIFENISNILATNIENGKIVIGPMICQVTKETREIQYPSVEIVNMIGDFEAIAIDDKFFNAQRINPFSTRKETIVTTINLLEQLYTKDVLSFAQLLSFRSNLRHAGYVFVSLNSDELDYHLSKAEVVNGVLKETADLKIIREYLLLLRMSDLVKLPRDAQWLIDIHKNLSKCLINQWVNFSDELDCIAKSNWLYSNLNYQEWAHCFENNGGHEMARSGNRNQIHILMIGTTGMQHENKEKYWNWIEEKILSPLKVNDHKSYNNLIESAKRTISKMSKPTDTDEELLDERKI